MSKKKGDGCCRPWIDYDTMEEENWKSFKEMIEKQKKEENFKSEFLEDMGDAGASMLHARELLIQLKEKSGYLKENNSKITREDAHALFYELKEGFEFLTAEIEDVKYFIEKLESADWNEWLKPTEPDEMDLLYSLAELIKQQYEIIYQILMLRYSMLKSDIELIEHFLIF